MRYLIMMFCAVFVFAAPAAKAQDTDAIQSVISRQLAAFNDRDVDAAWTHASPMIQRLFGDPERFGSMVKNGYPMVWDNRDPQFLELRMVDGAPMQRVMIKDLNGDLHALDYKMIATSDGWQIDGVWLIALDLTT
jgi:hypothetical protein